jgi:hypothetical protein
MKNPLLIKVPNFYREATRLRRYFDQIYANPHEVSPERFSWDHWHVPGQYKLLRTPAARFFPDKILQPFLESLVQYGRRELGCHGITPIWLSAYVDGCEQKLHVDRPHGPWAFVYSLCSPKARFQGGETLLLRPEILDYWNHLPTQGSFESREIFESLYPNFNQLTVFDPRIPHGVNQVSMAPDLPSARLVLHGWFVPPRPYIDGALKPAKLQKAIDALSVTIDKQELFVSARGYLGIRFSVSPAGEVRSPTLLRSTLRGTSTENINADTRRLLMLIRELRFGSQPATSRVTLPLVFGEDG